MDRFAGTFGSHDGAEPYGYDLSDFGPGIGYDDHDDDGQDFGDDSPLSPVGQDERRMQVRAYNHWAGLLGDGALPDIAELKPETLTDFGPYGVLLHFDDGVEDPRLAFIGDKLAQECDMDSTIRRLSDVPSRSLLSRITDHYMQILANQAPIGFEAEFQNGRGVEVLYRGILLQWSSDGETINYIFGVINWKELADAATAEAILSEIDAALRAPIPAYEGNDMDRMLDLSQFASDDGDDEDETAALPVPRFGVTAAAPKSSPLELTSEDFADEFSETSSVQEYDEDEEEDEDTAYQASEWGAGFSGFDKDEAVYTVDYGDQGLEDGEADEDDYDGVVDPLGDESASLGLSSLVSRGTRNKQSVSLPDSFASAAADPASDYRAAPISELKPASTLEQRLRAAIPQPYEPSAPASVHAPAPAPGFAALTSQPVETPSPDYGDGHFGEAAFGGAGDTDRHVETQNVEAAPPLDLDAYEAPEEPVEPVAFEASPVTSQPASSAEEPGGLYDCLAEARELAQTARSNEDRGRKALYQAVGRAYDFSLEAAANPSDFDELLAEYGLTAQERAPMTPIVKLVFGIDYDKTRLTEYATVLGYAHRIGIERGALADALQQVEGGLKGVVQAERRARKEAAGEAAPAHEGVRPALARKLRSLDAVELDDLEIDGPEFALVMVRRTADGSLEVIGEVPEDVKLVEKAARSLIA